MQPEKSVNICSLSQEDHITAVYLSGGCMVEIHAPNLATAERYAARTFGGFARLLYVMQSR